MKTAGAIIGACLLVAGSSQAMDLPAGRLIVDTTTEESLQVPVTPFAEAEGGVQTIWAEGTVWRRVWHVQTPGKTTSQIAVPLREQLLAQGYGIVFECLDRTCGGFRFRFETDALPAPEMFVDLGDYHYIVAQKTIGTQLATAIAIISRSASGGHVQLTVVTPEGAQTQLPDLRPGAGPAVQLTNPGQALDQIGRSILSDLTFGSGSSALGEGPFASLETLAEWLNKNQEARVLLVGHTDTSGDLGSNVALSRARAEAVMQRLIDNYDIDAARMGAEGVGYLSPLARNDSEVGRQRNRRVEVVLLD